MMKVFLMRSDFSLNAGSAAIIEFYPINNIPLFVVLFCCCIFFF